MSIRLKFLIATLAACAAIAMPSTALAAQSSSASPANLAASHANVSTATAEGPTGPHHFKNLATGYCILVRGIAGVYALDGPCNGRPAKNREWFLSLRTVGNNHLGWYHIQSENTGGGCLGIGPVGDLVQQTCRRGDLGQQWRELTGSGHSRGKYHQWINRSLGQCMGISGNTVYAVVKISPCFDNRLEQFWWFQHV